MRLSAIFIRILAFSVAAAGSVAAAQLTVATVEDRSVEAVHLTLIENGHDWADVLGDGLQVILEGTAPSEAVRFRAVALAGTVVDASRVIDNMSVLDQASYDPPDFKIEILRNDSGVSLIGLIPAGTTTRSELTEIFERGSISSATRAKSTAGRHVSGIG